MKPRMVCIILRTLIWQQQLKGQAVKDIVFLACLSWWASNNNSIWKGLHLSNGKKATNSDRPSCATKRHFGARSFFDTSFKWRRKCGILCILIIFSGSRTEPPQIKDLNKLVSGLMRCWWSTFPVWWP